MSHDGAFYLMHGGAYQSKVQATRSNGLYYYHDAQYIPKGGCEKAPRAQARVLGNTQAVERGGGDR